MIKFNFRKKKFNQKILPLFWSKIDDLKINQKELLPFFVKI